MSPPNYAPFVFSRDYTMDLTMITQAQIIVQVRMEAGFTLQDLLTAAQDGAAGLPMGTLGRIWYHALVFTCKGTASYGLL
ncbi:hypothetical protein JX266_006839 [Neoarthrinium moseri]|nr:hypothetical protein JX266_006839 [Neoarthrinium moseri]